MNPKQDDHSHQTSTEESDTQFLLRRILASLEKDRGRGRLELVIAIILSLTTLATTWCGYQARLWGSVKSTNQAAADTAERQAAEDTIVGLQLRTFDGIAMIEYWAAVRNNDTKTSDAIFARVRPQLQKAIEASIAAGVLENPEVAGPLQRPEYILKEEQDAKRLRARADELNAAAQDAGHHADAYILLTLMFASVLFFGGIASTFTARRVRVGLALAALLLFVVTMASLVGLPVGRS